MPINFPNSPSLNDLYSYDNKTWEWNGIYWEVYSALTSYITSAYTAGDGVSDISGVTNGNLVLKSFSGVGLTITDSGDKLTFISSGSYLPTSGGTVTGGTIFQSGVTANTITISGSTLTGSGATSALDISQTWNTTGTPIALKVNITDTVSASLSDLISLQVGGAVRFRVVKSGYFEFSAGGGILGNLCVGASNINASSQLEVRSTTKGFLPPRMTTTQKNAIATPATGLTVYQTTDNYLSLFNGTNWQNIVSPNSAGNVILNGTSGNTLIGTTTDAGYRLDVSGSVRTTGTISAATAIARGTYLNQTLVATANNDVLVGLDIQPTFTLGAFTGVTRFPLRIRNSANDGSVFGVTNDGVVRWGNRIESGNNTGQLSWDTDLVFINAALNLGFRTVGSDRMRIFSTGNVAIATTTDAGYRLDVNGQGRFVGTILSTGAYSVSSGTYDIFNNATTVVPLSGNMVVNGFAYNSTINQTGGASGVTRGVHINPTLTSAFDFRGIQWTNNTGYGLYGSGNAPNYIQGNTLIGTTANTGTYKLDVRGLTRFSASTGTSLTVISSGNSTSAPVFSVQGSQGELFSVTDSLTGSLFSVSDISGLPIMEVFSDSTIVLGDYQAPSLYTTKRVTSITATTGTTIYSFPTSAYTSSFVDYYVSGSTGLRAGNIMAIWSGSSVNFTETSTNDLGSTTPVTFGYVMSGSSAVLRASASTGTWIVESILRGL